MRAACLRRRLNETVLIMTTKAYAATALGDVGWRPKKRATIGMSVTQRAIDEIKAMIIRGELAAGERLPKEADLAARLGISRNSLREAVRALSLIHVLDVRQGDGTYVTTLQPSLLLDAMAFVVDFHRDDTVLQFFEVRRILDQIAAVPGVQSTSMAMCGLLSNCRARMDFSQIEGYQPVMAATMFFRNKAGTKAREERSRLGRCQGNLNSVHEDCYEMQSSWEADRLILPAPWFGTCAPPAPVALV